MNFSPSDSRRVEMPASWWPHSWRSWWRQATRWCGLGAAYRTNAKNTYGGLGHVSALWIEQHKRDAISSEFFQGVAIQFPIVPPGVPNTRRKT